MQGVADTITSGGKIPGCGARAAVGGTRVNGFWERIERISAIHHPLPKGVIQRNRRVSHDTGTDYKDSNPLNPFPKSVGSGS